MLYKPKFKTLALGYTFKSGNWQI